MTSLLCAVLYLGFAIENDTAVAQIPLLFFALPVALWAITFGLKGGLLAAAASYPLMVYGSDLSQLGYFSRVTVLMVLGGAVGLFADERRRLVRELDRHNELSLDLIAVASFDGVCTRLNPAWTRTLGYSRAELLARPFLELFHPSDRDATAGEAARLVELGGELVCFENRALHRDGSVRWLEWNIRADTEARRFIVIGRDVSARKEAEQREEQRAHELAQALEDSCESNLRLNLVAEAVLDGLVTFDEESTILRFNTSAERIFGYRRDEVVGRSVSDLVPDPGQGRREWDVARYVRTGEDGIVGVRHEATGRRKDGSVFPTELTIGEVSRRGERIFIGVVRDVTERKQRELAELNYKRILEQTVQERTAELQERTVELDDARFETLRRLALAAEYRDDQTFEHTQRVGRTAALLGELLGLTAREVRTLQQAAPLHDIGKLAVSDTILLKPGGLTPEEWEQMKSHTATGEAILSGSNSDVLSLAAEIALTHHEWWDGSGYPAGLKGEEIPLHGRIVCLADVYDALTHHRPYKRPWSVERAVSEIQRLRGSQLDPAVVDAFEQLDPYELAEGRQTAADAPRLAAGVI